MSDKHAVRIAVVAAILAAVLVRAHIARFELERSGGPAQSVLGFDRDAVAGSRLERSMLSVRELPEQYVETRHIAASALDRVLGSRLALPARAGEALLWTDLEELRPESRNLAALVAPGMRAITIAPRSARTLRLLRPGDRVDVLFTGGAERGQEATRTLLQSVLILAVGTDTGDAEASETGADTRELTLAVEATGAQLIAHAEAQGALRVVLRNPNDGRIAQDLPETTGLGLLASGAPATAGAP